MSYTAFAQRTDQAACKAGYLLKNDMLVAAREGSGSVQNLTELGGAGLDMWGATVH